VFAGPGSPSYLARQWLATGVPDALRRRLTGGDRSAATVFASAAACTVGRLAIPVYELYKVGEAPHWRDGLDLLRPLGLDAIVVPHYDNAEGGTHDTSCCYIGDRRLRTLESSSTRDVGPRCRRAHRRGHRPRRPRAARRGPRSGRAARARRRARGRERIHDRVRRGARRGRPARCASVPQGARDAGRPRCRPGRCPTGRGRPTASPRPSIAR
jgi:hypothetical protein